MIFLDEERKATKNGGKRKNRKRKKTRIEFRRILKLHKQNKMMSFKYG